MQDQKQKESDRLMKQMTKKSLRTRPPVLNTSKNVSRGGRTKPMVLLLDSLKQSASPNLVYLSPDFLISQSSNEILLGEYQKKRAFQPAWTLQESAVAFAKARESDKDGLGTRGFLLCDEMGLGKTKSILTLILEQNQADSRKSGQRFNGPTLIVCRDLTLIEQTWLKEVEGFPEQTFFYEILTTESTRKEMEGQYYLEHCCDIVFTTYSTVTNTFMKTSDNNRHRVLFDIQWRRVAADEAHIMVNQNTDVFSAMSALHSPIKAVITGTPKQNHDSDIVTLCRFAGLQLEKEREIPLERIMIRRLNKDFQQDFSTTPIHSLPEKREPVSRSVEYVNFATNQEKLLYCVYAKLALQRKNGLNITYLISIMRELCICPAVIKNLVLPDCLIPFQQKPLEEAPKEQTSKLKKIISKILPKRDFSVTYRAGEFYRHAPTKDGCQSDGYQFEWKYRPGLEESEFWKQLCRKKDWSEPIDFFRAEENDSKENRASMLDVLDRVIRFDRPMSKERAMLEHMSRTPREDKIVIFSDMIEPLDRMAAFTREYLGLESIVATGETKNQNNQRIEEFRRNPSIKSLLMTLKFGNEGLNIPEANYIYFIDPWWNPSVMRQGEFRIQRPGQKKKVYIVYFIMNNTIESYVMNQTEKKNNIQSSLSLTRLKKETSPLFDYSVSLSL